MTLTYIRAMLAAIVLGCTAGCAQTHLTAISGSTAPLRERFNAEADRPRVVALFSPT